MQDYVFLVILAVVLRPGWADEDASGAVYLWKPDEYPSMPNQPKYCTGPLRNPPTSVCDPDGILTPEEARHLDTAIDAEQNHTACLCEPCRPKKPDGNARGLLIKVALVRSVDRFLNLTIDELLEHFAERTRAKWNLAPRCHHDVLVMVATTYGKVAISMGSKADLVIGQSDAHSIVSSTRRHFQRNDIATGLENIINSLHQHAESYDPRLGRLGLRQSHIIWIAAGLLLLLLVIVLIWYRLKRDSKKNAVTNGNDNYSRVSQNHLQET